MSHVNRKEEKGRGSKEYTGTERETHKDITEGKSRETDREKRYKNPT